MRGQASERLSEIERAGDKEEDTEKEKWRRRGKKGGGGEAFLGGGSEGARQGERNSREKSALG